MTLSATAPAALPGRLGEAGIALLAALAYVALNAAAGFPTLSNSAGEADSLLRLVEVRDLIAGQNWFDLTQYRLGVDGGVPMHWSRLVDAPIVAIVLAASAVTGSTAAGEAIALVLWPALLFAAALYFLLRAARALAGPDTLLPALLVGAAALHYTGVFMPGALDHHNLQLTLTLATLSLLLDATKRDSTSRGAAAGACTALLLAVAMEGAPYVAAAGAAVALLWLADPARWRRTTLGFALAFGGVAAAAFVATVSPTAWRVAQCDAFSLPQFAGAALAGFGLAAIVASRAAEVTLPRRLAALGGLAVLLAAMFVAAFPQCLADPYAGLDPRLKDWWLDAVVEAQPLWKIVAIDPALAAGHYVTPLLGLILLAAAMARRGFHRCTALVAAFLGVAFLVSVWQVRGSVFSIPLAAIPLAGFVAHCRRQANATPSTAATLKMAAAWVISLSVVWSGATTAIAGAVAPGSAVTVGLAAAGSVGACDDAADYAELATMPATGVLIISNLGTSVLSLTPHHVLAGPYHRNVAGNLAALDAFAGPPAEAEAILDRNGITIVALCRGNDETGFIAERAPGGLLAALLSDRVPAWLEPLAHTRATPLELYRVRSGS